MASAPDSMEHPVGYRPLLALFPGLQRIPMVPLCTLPSPVQRIAMDHASLWIKRDDLNAETFGCNKVRSLEFLLGTLKPGMPVLTLGGAGSTHVLATALQAQRIGSPTIAMRWRHDMNVTADRVDALTQDQCLRAPVTGMAVSAIMRAWIYRLFHRVHYVPAGGSSPLGVLGIVNAALEFVQQVQTGMVPKPARVVIPLGSGGTMAGLALGFAIANFDTMVVGAQVAPAVVANRPRISRLIHQTAGLIEQYSGETMPKVSMHRIAVVRDVYAGAYGRPSPDATLAAQHLAVTTGIRLDETYSAKAFAVARELARADHRPTLFWNTFDGRILPGGMRNTM